MNLVTLQVLPTLQSFYETQATATIAFGFLNRSLCSFQEIKSSRGLQWGLFMGCLGMAGTAGRMWIYYLTPEWTRGGKCSLLGLSPEVGGKLWGQEKARTGPIQVLEKQTLSVSQEVQKMLPEAGEMLQCPGQSGEAGAGGRWALSWEPAAPGEVEEGGGSCLLWILCLCFCCNAPGRHSRE